MPRSSGRRRRRSGGLSGGGGPAIGLNVKGVITAASHGLAALVGLTGPTALIRKVSSKMAAGNFLVFTPDKPWGNIAAHAAVGVLGAVIIKMATRRMRGSTSLAATFCGAAIARPLSALLMAKVDPTNEFGLSDDGMYFGPGSGMGADFSNQQYAA